MAYSGHNGVRYARYSDDEDEHEPVVDETDAVLEELYYEDYGGEICITVETEDGFLSIQVPVKADRSWNGFVESLPKWD